MTIEIRYLGPGDEDLFERVAPDVFDNAIDRATLRHYLGTPGHHLIVAISNGEIVGHLAAVVHRHPDLRPIELYVDEVASAPPLRPAGLAGPPGDLAFDPRRGPCRAGDSRRPPP